MKLSVILFGIAQVIKITAGRYPWFKDRLKEKNFTAQLKVKDNSEGRYFTFKNGKLTSKRGIHPNPDVCMTFSTTEVALKIFTNPKDYLGRINALKNFQLGITGPDELQWWWSETLSLMMSAGMQYGTDMGKGVMRYTSNTIGGPVFVYVKDGRILRITPIDLDKSDAPSWTIEARGRKFTPPRKTTLSPYILGWKSLVYSPDRLLYPMKRVDFDPNGERNCESRGISGYERISWDEALDIVANEIKRIKKEYGPGAIVDATGSHHTWGNIGYWLSARLRFMNIIGHTPVMGNPDSWEGWYWGAVHHWGHSSHLGGGEPYGYVEDCLKDCEMMVFWSSDPETSNGIYAGMEGTVRRQWLKELGIKMVHIDPFYNHTAALLGGKWFAPRPDTGHAMAFAIAYIWVTEDLYDKEYVATRTTGFEKWKDYLLGKEDGIPKTPEWQEKETTIPAKDVRALARAWGARKTYLAAGGMSTFGGACRSAVGIEWARCMVCLLAMQGVGKPGINLGNMQWGAPLDTTFYFPGYSEGGISGDLTGTASAAQLYQRMPHVLTMNNINQAIPRLRLPEAVLEGQTAGHVMDPRGIENQFACIPYPTPGYAPVKMLYKYGGSFIGTLSETNRYVKMYRSEKLPFVVNQSIWYEGEAKFADIILPACTSFERWDIGEWANSGGIGLNAFTQVNHRVIAIQHKCIEPLGESKSDYQIFLELAKRLGVAAMFTEAQTEIDWCRRIYDASDLPKKISWKKFLKKGYYVVPAPPEKLRPPCSMRWFAEGRLKDTPDPLPLAADYKDKYWEGLQTQSGKIEFEASSLKRLDPDDPERPPLPTYIISWEGHHTTELTQKYPLQLISPHPRYSFHTQSDAKDGIMNDVKDHRILIDGYYYWIARINSQDARERGINDKDLVKLFNDRGAVICAAQVTERVPPGTVHSYSSSAIYDPVGIPGESPDRAGCVNLLTPKRFIIKKSHSTACNSCLIQIEKWEDKGTVN